MFARWHLSLASLRKSYFMADVATLLRVLPAIGTVAGHAR
jgi:hypothetical protein